MSRLILAFVMWGVCSVASQAAVPVPTLVSAPQNPSWLTAVGDVVYFVVLEGTTSETAYGLWKTDGTDGGTVRVARGPGFGPLTAAEGAVFFMSPDGRIWRSDGTEAGTVPVTSAPADPVLSWHLVQGTSRALFWFTKPRRQVESVQLWTTFGMASGARPLAQLGNVWYPAATTVGDTLAFATQGGSAESMALWLSNGTPRGTFKFAAALGKDGPWGTPGPIAAVPGGVYLARCWQAYCSLWWSDLTRDGTVELTRFHSDTHNEDREGSDPNLIVAGRRLFFVVVDPESRATALWTSDGTPGGTLKLTRDDGPYPDRSLYPFMTAVMDGALFFPADSTDRTRTLLWRSDGTPSGTAVVSHVTPFGGMAAVGDRLFFAGWDDGGDQELWTSDGTESGTTRLADLNPGPERSSPEDFTVAGGDLFFTAQRGDYVRRLYRMDLPSTVTTTTTIPATCSTHACEGLAFCSVPSCTDPRCVPSDAVDARRLWCACGRSKLACARDFIRSRLRRACEPLEAALVLPAGRRMRALTRQGARRIERALAVAADLNLSSECRVALDELAQP